MKKLLSIVMMLFISLTFINLNSYASEDFVKAMKKAKKNLKAGLDKSNEQAIIKARAEFERILQLKEDQWLVYYYIALADHGLATTGTVTNDAEKIKKYTVAGIETINKSIDINSEFADAYVLLEALNFNRWQYEQDKMQDIIAASQAADEQAKKLEPNNPRYLLITGIAQYYTPEAFGGGVKVAMPTLEKSIDYFKTRKEKSEIYPDWGNDLALGYMALSLIKRNDDGDIVKAKTLIDEATKLNPESSFISKYVMDEYNKNSK